MHHNTIVMRKCPMAWNFDWCSELFSLTGQMPFPMPDQWYFEFNLNTHLPCGRETLNPQQHIVHYFLQVVTSTWMIPLIFSTNFGIAQKLQSLKSMHPRNFLFMLCISTNVTIKHHSFQHSIINLKKWWARNSARATPSKLGWLSIPNGWACSY